MSQTPQRTQLVFCLIDTENSKEHSNQPTYNPLSQAEKHGYSHFTFKKPADRKQA